MPVCAAPIRSRVWGGDEFTLILTELGDTQRVETVAVNIRDALARPFSINDIVLSISGSIGIAMYPDNTTDTYDLVAKADTAMYGAKRQGRNRYCFYSGGLEG